MVKNKRERKLVGKYDILKSPIVAPITSLISSKLQSKEGRGLSWVMFFILLFCSTPVLLGIFV